VPIIYSTGPIDKVITVTKAVVEHLSSELPILNDEQRKERVDICQGCEFYHPLTTHCKQCGCMMAMKTRLPLAKCPINKWGIHPIAQKIIDENGGADMIGKCGTCPDNNNKGDTDDASSN